MLYISYYRYLGHRRVREEVPALIVSPSGVGEEKADCYESVAQLIVLLELMVSQSLS